MKIIYANIDSMDFPSFAYIICEENGLLYSPVYNRWNRVEYFTEVEIIHTFKININENLDIRKGDKCIYAYYCNNVIYLGEMKKIRAILMNLLNENKIRAPFSMLEVIQFLNIKGGQKNETLKLCRDYLLETTSPEFVRIWADSVKYKEITHSKDKNATPPVMDARESYINVLQNTRAIINKKAVLGSLTPDYK